MDLKFQTLGWVWEGKGLKDSKDGGIELLKMP